MMRRHTMPPYQVDTHRPEPPQPPPRIATTPHSGQTIRRNTTAVTQKNVPSTRRLNTYGSMSTSQFLVPRCVAHFSIF